MTARVLPVFFIPTFTTISMGSPRRKETAGGGRVRDELSFSVTWKGVQIGALQIENADFSNLDLRFGHFDLFLRCQGGGIGCGGSMFCVFHSFSHVPQLPDEQSGLAQGDHYQSGSECSKQSRKV